MSTVKSKRRKRCEYCEELKPPEDCQGGICEECVERFEWCQVCQDYINRDDECRHLYWTDCGYGGCGGTGLDADDHKPEFFALLDTLDAMPADQLGWAYEAEEGGIVDQLESKIAADNFWTRWSGSMFSVHELGFMHECRPGCRIHFAAIDPDPLGERKDAIELGIAWLTSLCADETKPANAIAVGWIREWRQARKAVPV